MPDLSGRIVSVNVGRAREIEWQGRTLRTAIVKQPVTGAVRVLDERLDGDEQADPTAHGGPEKSVYAYPLAHYAFWATQAIADELPMGAFGENLTVEGPDEDAVRIGDRFRAGDAEFIVRQPRFPCVKMCARFQRADMIDRFLASRRTGFYLSVAREGSLRAGDAFERLSSNEAAPTVLEIAHLYVDRDADAESLRRAIETPELAERMRTKLRDRLRRMEGEP